MNDQARLTELLHPYLNEGQFYIVDIQLSGAVGDGQRAGRRKALILLDSDTGITIEECASISRRLGAVLEETDLFGGDAFILEVSSPGIDLPLRFQRQYIRNIGRQLAVTLTNGTVLTGKLEAVTDEGIVLDIAPVSKPKKKKQDTPAEGLPEPVGPTSILFADINYATVQISFK